MLRLMRSTLSVVCCLSGLAAGPLQAQSGPARRVVQESAADYAKARRLTLAVGSRWCTADGQPGCDFRNPASVRATPTGGLLAADAMGPLRLFDRSGRFVRDLGRKGRGPGEYGFVVDAHVASDGYVTWFDNMQMRFTTVRPEGTPGPIRPILPPLTMANLFVVDTQLVIFDVPANATRGTMVEGTYRTVPTSGASRVLARVRTPSVAEPGTGMMVPPAPFAARVLADVSPALDVAHTNGDRAAIEVFPASGTPWRLELALPTRAVTPAERDSALAAALARLRVRRLADLPPPLRAVYDKLPAAHAPLQQLRLGADGTLWVRPTPARQDTLARWDGFTANGTRLGYVLLPLSARLWDGAKDWLLVTDRDADDRPRFTRYRVVR